VGPKKLTNFIWYSNLTKPKFSLSSHASPYLTNWLNYYSRLCTAVVSPQFVLPRDWGEHDVHSLTWHTLTDSYYSSISTGTYTNNTQFVLHDWVYFYNVLLWRFPYAKSTYQYISWYLHRFTLVNAKLLKLSIEFLFYVLFWLSPCPSGHNCHKRHIMILLEEVQVNIHFTPTVSLSQNITYMLFVSATPCARPFFSRLTGPFDIPSLSTIACSVPKVPWQASSHDWTFGQNQCCVVITQIDRVEVNWLVDLSIQVMTMLTSDDHMHGKAWHGEFLLLGLTSPRLYTLGPGARWTKAIRSR